MIAADLPVDRRTEAGLSAYAIFGAVLAAAGLPIYIHAPKVYAEAYGIGLGTLGLVLFGLRLFDLVQDPLLGLAVSRLGRLRGAAVAGSLGLMALAMLALFAMTPLFNPVAWFALSLIVLFTAYSFLSIAFYAAGIRRAADLQEGGHLRLAGWREAGALFGVCLAAMAPTVLGHFSASPYSIFAVGFAAACGLAAVAMRKEWAGGVDLGSGGFGAVLRDQIARRLLILALVNAAPLAVTSTLFLFFVEGRLGLPGWEGPLLILFFLAAAVSTPVWSSLARKHGEKTTLLCAMALAILTFGYAATLSTGDLIPFAVVCVLSGAMTGADLVIMPAAFARRLAVIAPEGGQGFGLWSFATKFTLAFAAAVLLPTLDAAGYVSGGSSSPPEALRMLSILYAVVPCCLKLVAVALLSVTPMPKD